MVGVLDTKRTYDAAQHAASFSAAQCADGFDYAAVGRT